MTIFGMNYHLQQYAKSVLLLFCKVAFALPSEISGVHIALRLAAQGNTKDRRAISVRFTQPRC